jgi:hypothetical protein
MQIKTDNDEFDCVKPHIDMAINAGIKISACALRHRVLGFYDPQVLRLTSLLKNLKVI